MQFPPFKGGIIMKDKVYLGNTTEYGKLYLSKHSWSCGWYWSFGYIGNSRHHMHIDSIIGAECAVRNIFDKGTPITQNQWWVVRDLFKQAYALQGAAEIYQYGGHQTSTLGLTDCIKNLEMAALINKDLEIVLDKVWDFIVNEVKR